MGKRKLNKKVCFGDMHESNFRVNELKNDATCKHTAPSVQKFCILSELIEKNSHEQDLNQQSSRHKYKKIAIGTFITVLPVLLSSIYLQ